MQVSLDSPPPRLTKKAHPGFKYALWFHQDRGKCYYCGRQCIWFLFPAGVNVPDNAFTLEHIVPKRRGGSRAFTNTVGSCLECNKRQDFKLRAIEYFNALCGGLMEPKDTVWELDR